MLNQIDWGMVGGIAAVIIIPVTIIGIVLSFLQGKKKEIPTTPTSQISADNLNAGRDINIHLGETHREPISSPSVSAQTKSESLKEQFERLQQRMPELINEMRDDVSNDKSTFVRKFRVKVRSDFPLFWDNDKEKRFEYYEETHEYLRNMLTILEREGYVKKVSYDSYPIYDMSEKFIETLRAGKL